MEGLLLVGAATFAVLTGYNAVYALAETVGIRTTFIPRRWRA